MSDGLKFFLSTLLALSAGALVGVKTENAFFALWTSIITYVILGDLIINHSTLTLDPP
jgi:hypothetical protein